MSKKLQLVNQIGVKAEYADGELSLENCGFITSPVTSVNGNTGDVVLTASDIAGVVSEADISDLQSKIGDKPVSEQISSAITSAGVLTIDTTDAEAGTVPFTNSNMLGGKAASEYALKTDINDLADAIASAGNVKTVAGKSPDDSGNVALTAADVGARSNEWMPSASDVGAAVITFYTLIFPASGWAQRDDGAYTQQVAADGLTANYNGHIDIDMSTATVDTATDIQDAWAMIGRAQSVDGGLLLTAFNEAPTIDMTIKLEVIR